MLMEIGMRTLAMLGLTIALGASSCVAQEASDPSSVIRSADLTDYSVAIRLPSDLHFASTSSGTVIAVHPATPRAPRAADASFFLLNSGFLGMAVLDVEMTQRCIATHRCREQNPLMPSSQAGQLGLNIGLVAGISGASYWLKKHKSALWWLPAATGIVGHSAGVATGIEHQ
jgi:hypothetical protein